MHTLRSLFTTRTRASRRLLLSLSAALLVIAGLLAMHGFNVDAGHASMGSADPTVAHAVLGHHADTDQGAENALTQCGDSCGGAGHLVMAMVCVLAIMAASLALTMLPTKSVGSYVKQLLRRLSAAVTTLAPPHPPSLVALSISRT